MAEKKFIKRKKALKLSFDYMDTSERRVLSLVPDGVPCVPVLGFDAYRSQWRVAPIHVHEECLEISLCLRGDLPQLMRLKHSWGRAKGVSLCRSLFEKRKLAGCAPVRMGDSKICWDTFTGETKHIIW